MPGGGEPGRFSLRGSATLDLDGGHRASSWMRSGPEPTSTTLSGRLWRVSSPHNRLTDSAQPEPTGEFGTLSPLERL